VNTKDFPIDDGGQGQVVEYFGTVTPDGGTAVFAHTFVVESVDSGDLA